MKTIAIIPAYNEGERTGNVVQDAQHFVDAVIVIDDGSTDALTAQSARDAGAIVLSHIENCGAGAATMTGIEAARMLGADCIVTLDADEQHNPDDIPALLTPINNDTADIVFANRFGRRNRIPFIRRFANGIGNMITFAVTGKWVSDSQCGFKVFGPKATREINLRMSGYEFCSEIVRECAQHRWRTAEVPAKVL